jgi:hypothetical protein
MKNGKRELSDCVEGSRRDWNHARKYLRLVWAGWRRPWISASDRKKFQQCFFLFIYFPQHTYIIKFSVYLFSIFCLPFRAIFCFINLDYHLIQMLIQISEGVLCTNFKHVYIRTLQTVCSAHLLTQQMWHGSLNPMHIVHYLTSQWLGSWPSENSSVRNPEAGKLWPSGLG